MHKTTLYLDPDMYERIRRIANATRRTQAAVIREALEVYTRGRTRRPRSIGIARGPADVSQRAEELLPGFGEDK
jgi:predicted transcriptional regulator